MKISLATITPSHYRKRIYSLLDSEMNCSFIFGKDKTTVNVWIHQSFMIA